MTTGPSIRRPFRLSAFEWRLLSTALVLQVVVACAMRIMSLPRIRVVLAALRPFSQIPVESVEAGNECATWAIEATGRRLSFVSTCLVRAIVAELMLAPSRRARRLCIGVKRGGGGTVLAHAWIVEGDRVLVGADGAEEFSTLVTWESHSA